MRGIGMALIGIAAAFHLGPAMAADVIVQRGHGARTTVTYAHYLPPKVALVGFDWTKRAALASRSVVVLRTRY